ncbi:MAG: glycosyltransferase family 2 protein [Microbacterium sp.]|jgi:glycosyltransferase involved in cell wall biosynthesis|nr:glycosyltransferase family 2 protein [Microbacterium sp.]
MPGPLVTIGIPLVNEDMAEIRLAVRSVYAQSLPDWELVFFCDGSSAERVRMLEGIDDPRVSIIVNETSQGIASSLNRLADMATGKYIAILAADDMWTPDRLEKQIARMEEADAPDVLAAQMVVISDSVTVEGAQKPARVPNSSRGWVEGTPISHATAVARSGWFRDHPYDTRLIRAQDRAFWIRSHKGSRIEIMDEAVYFYRVPKPLSYRKYAWGSKYARQVIWRYGREVCSVPAVAVIYAKSLVKQAVVAAATLLGRSDRLYYRRIDPLTGPELEALRRDLEEISRTTVPGWPSGDGSS